MFVVWPPPCTRENKAGSGLARSLIVKTVGSGLGESISETHLHSCICTVKYLVLLRRYYNKNVKERFFVVGDLVLKWKTNQAGVHKLATPWEGPS